jgi:hypothetical protein
VYYRHLRKGEADEEITIFILYVDDELILSSNKAVLNEMMEFLGKEIDVRSIPPDRFIGIDINRNRIQRTIHLSQPDYVKTVLERFNMSNRSTLSVPADPCAKLPPQMCPQRCDNQGAIALIRDPVFHQRTRHIDVRFFFVREAQEQKKVDISYIESENQLADIFTKALAAQRFEKLRERLNICEQPE